MMKEILKAQITTILVFIMAALFLFTLITINISRIAQKKTTISNIADSVGLRLASQLGSTANALKQEFEIYGAKTESCDVNWQLIWGGLLAIAAIAAGVIAIFFSAGLATPVVIALASLAITSAIGAGTNLYFGVSQQLTASNLAAQEQMKLKFKSLSSLQQIIESPVHGVLSGIVDDPALVKDRFDMDRDSDKEDFVPRFFKWYILRLNSFPAIGPEVESFYKNFFIDRQGKDRFNIKEENGMVVKRNKKDDPERPDSEGWWVDWWVDAEGGVDVDGDGYTDGDGVREIKLVPWFDKDLRSMLTKMRGENGKEYGYGINVQVDKGESIIEVDGEKITVQERITITDSGWTTYEEIINNWVKELEEFENGVVRSLRDMDRDTAIQGLDSWLNFLIYKKNEILCPGIKEKEEKNQDWYSRLSALQKYAEELRDKLIERKGQIHDCIEPCERRAPGCCGGEDQWDCCSWSTCRLQVPGGIKSRLLAYNKSEGSISDVEAGILSSNEKWIFAQNEDDETTEDDEEEEEEEPCVPVCLENWGCCGDPKDCGQLCNDDHCKPKHTCYPPLGPARWCCEVLPLESSSECSSSSETKIINIVDRYKAIEVLNKFIADVREIRNLMVDFYNRVEKINKETYDKMHEAFYLWRDYVGTDSSDKQEVAHIAYVKFDVIKVDDEEIEDPRCFGLPTIKHTSKLLPYPRTCVAVRNATGEFTLTVARFDEDTARKGPLSKFWRFRFSRFRGEEKDYEQKFADLRVAAGAFQDATVKEGRYPEISEAYKKNLIDILKNYGIVTRIKVHYGPGETQTEEYWKKVSPADKEKRENKDIYIMETSSKMD